MRILFSIFSSYFLLYLKCTTPAAWAKAASIHFYTFFECLLILEKIADNNLCWENVFEKHAYEKHEAESKQKLRKI